MTRKQVLTIAGAAILFGIGSAAFAADASKEISTAATHAGYAADATEMKTAQAHLRHTINCLVGPNGAGFDATQANPCKDQGAGAIPDTSDAAKKMSLQAAVAKAMDGLKQTDLAAAKKDGADAKAILMKVSN
ncbi:MAG TPA: hypothetical protein VI113_08710 [Alphaproteobacteria bacterium]